MKTIFITAFLVMLTAGTVSAENCLRIQPYLNEARQKIVITFAQGDTKGLNEEINTLLFWDTYAQIECHQGQAVDTPILWLSRQTNNTLTPYLAGFLFWLEHIRQYQGLDLTPIRISKRQDV